MNIRNLPALCAAWLLGLPAGAAPSITSFNPVFGGTNDNTYINIYGSGFGAGNLVIKFNGVAARDVNTNLLGATCWVGPNTPLGRGQIYVSANGSGIYSADYFTVIGPGPFVTNFIPISGAAGTTVAIQGEHFLYPAIVTNVSFNGISGTGLSVNQDILLTVTAPPGVSTGPIILKSSMGTFSTISNFITTATNFYVTPAVTGFSPPRGRPGTNVLITGSNFLGATAVTFGGVPASFTPPTNNTTLVAVVPAGASTGILGLTVPAGAIVSSSNFVVQPTVTGFSPAHGNVNSNILITGINLEGVTNVYFGGARSLTVSGATATQLTATVPSGTTNAPITVATTNGTYTTSQIFSMPPAISSFTPTNSGVGSRVAVTGQNFLGATDVEFNGTPALFTVTNNTVLGATVPAGVVTGPISVTTPAGTVTNAGLVFYGPPAITTFAPQHGLPRTNVMVTGINFLGTTRVLVGGTNVTFYVTNNTTLGFVAPTNPVPGPVTVMGVAGTNTSANSFTSDGSDLSVQLAAAPSQPFAGTPIQYTITVLNNGSLTAPGVTLTNFLPAGVALTGAFTSQGSLNTNANPVLGNLGTLGVGSSATILLTVNPQSAGTLTDSASAASSNPDLVPGNNSASIQTTAQPPFLTIASLTNQVQVSWPLALSNFTLQYIPALSPDNNWSNLPALPDTTTGSNVVLDPVTNAARIYRLKQ
ncbi:MAG: IPT/TIG domain-containing protein [Verrucomicrobiota bacterium]